MYVHIPTEAITIRYPRLIFLLRCQAILSQTEAACCIRDYRMGRDDHRLKGSGIMRWGGGEAVEHYGGPLKLLGDAIAARRAWRPQINISLVARAAGEAHRLVA